MAAYLKHETSMLLSQSSSDVENGTANGKRIHLGV